LKVLFYYAFQNVIYQKYNKDITHRFLLFCPVSHVLVSEGNFIQLISNDLY